MGGTWTQQPEPVCMASHKVTFAHGLMRTLPSGVDARLPAGLLSPERLTDPRVVVREHGFATWERTMKGWAAVHRRRSVSPRTILTVHRPQKALP